MTIFLISIGVFALFFILLSVRLLFIKDGQFRGTCASQSPWLNKEGVACGFCGKEMKPGDTTCGDPQNDNREPLPSIQK
jgi:hypothetical protein